MLVILLFTTFNLLSELINETVVKRATTTSNLFYSTTKNAFLAFDLASLEADVKELMANPDIDYVRIVDTQNRIFAQSGNDALLSQPFEADTHVEQATNGTYDIRTPITIDDTVYGYIDIGINISSVKASLEDIRHWATFLAIIEMALVALFSFALGSYLTKQLKSLQIGARALMTGQDEQYRNVHIAVKSNDELGELATAFNHLAKHLQIENVQRKEAEFELQRFNESLEQLISERTAELHKKNEELDQTNRSLKEAQVQLLQAEKMASVGQLAAGVAHEINNPVGFVTSNVETLTDYVSTYRLLFLEMDNLLRTSEDVQINPNYQILVSSPSYQNIDFINDDLEHLLNESRDGLKRVEAIVQGLKQFSRVDSDDSQLASLNDCVKGSLAMVNNKLKYVCHVQTHFAKLPTIQMNVGKISQIVTNLLINAAQAIETTKLMGELTISTCCKDDFVELRVKDTGCGISEANIRKVFNPFFTTKSEEEGTGLGLSISYGIAREHGGSLAVESTEGQGTCFTLRLPIKK
nr:ATP-binding protein [Aestuariibacter sp. A3R04]